MEAEKQEIEERTEKHLDPAGIQDECADAAANVPFAEEEAVGESEEQKPEGRLERRVDVQELGYLAGGMAPSVAPDEPIRLPEI